MATSRELFGNYLNMLPRHDQPKVWQMIESFSVYWDQTGKVPAHHCFDLPADVITAAKMFIQNLKSLSGPDAIEAEFMALKARRPRDLEQLPRITADTAPLEELMKTKTRQYQPIFRSLEHQKAAKEEYDQLNDKKKAANVPDCQDFPPDADKQHMLLSVLFDAILDTSKAEEKPRLLPKKTNKKRKASEMEGETEDQTGNAEDREWVPNTYVKRIEAASDVEIQFLAWNLLFAIRDAQSGLVGIGPWATNWKYNSFESFADRFLHVADVCRRSKATVVSMMSADDIFTKRLAAGPLKEINQKRQNKATNQTRDVQTKVALYFQARGFINEDEKGHLVAFDGERIDPSPPETPKASTTQAGQGPVNSDNIPPESQPLALGSLYPLAQGDQPTYNMTEGQVQQTFLVASPSPSHPGTERNICHPAQGANNDFSPGSGNAFFGTAPGEAHRSPSAFTGQKNMSNAQWGYDAGPGGQDVYHFGAGQGSADRDCQ